MALPLEAHITGEPPDEDEEGDDRALEEAYEREYAGDHSWEALQEDEQGRLRPLDTTAAQRARRQRALSAAKSSRIRKGMIRYLVLVVDLSRAASCSDMRPSRLAVMTGAAKDFIRAYFDQNPLSQLGVVVMRDGLAARLTELSGSPEQQISQLSAHMEASGDASLQNALQVVAEMLRHVPPYGAREALLLMAALSTVDPGDVYSSIKTAKELKIRASVVGVSAEVYVARRLAEDTGGSYGVSLHEAHLQELLQAHAPPPPSLPGQLSAELVRMGFPQRTSEEPSSASFVGRLPELAPGAYTCPRCKARTAELPCRCHVCGLALVSSPHLARSYHHLFPVPPYEEVAPAVVAELVEAVAKHGGGGDVAHAGGGACVQRVGGVGDSRGAPWDEAGVSPYCYGCLRPLWGSDDDGEGAGAGQQPVGMVLRCPHCRQLFCFDCDAFVHETLHNCPGCECGVHGPVVAPCLSGDAVSAVDGAGKGAHQ